MGEPMLRTSVTRSADRDRARHRRIDIRVAEADFGLFLHVLGILQIGERGSDGTFGCGSLMRTSDRSIQVGSGGVNLILQRLYVRL